MNKKKQRIYCGLSAALLLLLSACGGGGAMSEDEREIAIAVALTQTAVAIDGEADGGAAADAAAPESELSTPVPSAEEPTATPPAAEATVAAEPTVAAADVSTGEEAAASEPEPTAPVATEAPATPLTAANLPVTQNQTKVRTLLVAPGEPGALYALLTDEADATAPATGARLLMSRNFGESWELSPSGLPVADDCLMNINMDYYGDTALYAGTCEGIYQWAPGDEEWTLISSELTGMVAVVYGNANTIWATRPYAPEGAPVLVSQNGGESWNEITVNSENGVANLGISPRESRNVYAIVWPAGDGSYLRRGSALSEWQTVPAPDNATINTGMTIDGGTGWLYVTTNDADGDRLWRSTDADTPIVEDVGWTMVHQFAPGITAELLASGWSPEENALAIYANLGVTTDGSTQDTLVRSIDSGQTWEPLIIDAG